MVIHYWLCVNTALFFFFGSLCSLYVFQSTQRLQNFKQKKTIKTMNKNNKLFDASHYDYVNSALTF